MDMICWEWYERETPLKWRHLQRQWLAGFTVEGGLEQRALESKWNVPFSLGLVPGQKIDILVRRVTPHICFCIAVKRRREAEN